MVSMTAGYTMAAETLAPFQHLVEAPACLADPYHVQVELVEVLRVGAHGVLEGHSLPDLFPQVTEHQVEPGVLHLLDEGAQGVRYRDAGRDQGGELSGDEREFAHPLSREEPLPERGRALLFFLADLFHVHEEEVAFHELESRLARGVSLKYPGAFSRLRVNRVVAKDRHARLLRANRAA
jgi:hypothetical protein